MIEDGLMDRFGIEQVYGMHNGPGIPVGSFAIRPGPIMAGGDAVFINIEGRGGHAARPHKCIDSVLVGAQLINALQSIVSRSVDPLEIGGDFDLRIPRRQCPQRDPANRQADRNRPHPGQRCAQIGGAAGARGRRRRGADDGRKDRADLQPRLSGHEQPSARKPTVLFARPETSRATQRCTRWRR